MPPSLFLSHSSNVPTTHSFPSKINRHYYSCTKISSSINPKPINNASKNSNSSSLTFAIENPLSKPAVGPIKTGTPPWVRTPSVPQPNEVTDLSKPQTRKTREKSGNELFEKLVNRRGNSTTKRIARSIEKLGEKVDLGETQKGLERITAIGDCLGTLELLGETMDSRVVEKMPWEREEGFVVQRMKKEKVASTAELTLEGELLERLRGEARKMRKWVKVMKAGITNAVVNDVRSIWKSDELVMLKFDFPLCRNMDRAQEILEMKTSGLVVWKRKDVLVIYRGQDYQPFSRTFSNVYRCIARHHDTSSSSQALDSHEKSMNGEMSYSNAGIASVFGDYFNFLPNSSLYERETDRLLDGLGPRFVDWWMNKPLPVDADLLPEVVPGFRPPFRRCPPRTRSQLLDDELTYLRKIARPLPTHFVLGRNRNLQGLAVAILKVWEKCHIVKIAVKLGAVNTSNEQMAYELKCLTGGVILLRNKFIIILYRGKDFLPPQVSELISKREMELENCQVYEESARLEAKETFSVSDELEASIGSTGTLSEFQDIQIGYMDPNKENKGAKLPFEAEKEKLEKELRNQLRKLSILKNKIERSTKELLKLNAAWKPSEQDADGEIITEEERECFRKIGLKMHRVLLLGRRGIFDGVVEGLHQHWKHREVAKVITMQRLYWQVVYTAKRFEAETGGILISVEKQTKGHAIIIYRGKNYRRPLRVKSGNLLTKRKALLRSLEIQRNGSLKFFAYQRQRAVSELKLKLENLQNILEVN